MPGILLAGSLACPVFAQDPLTWQQVRGRFETDHPTLKAGRLGIDEIRQDEAIAFLRLNPTATAITDELGIFTPYPYRPFANGIYALSVDYLDEPEHKRELRFQSACEETKIQTSQQGELEPNLVYNLHIAFSQTVQAIEQAHTEIGRSERLRDATETAALSDVDSAYATVMSTIELLKRIKINICVRHRC